MTNPSESVHMVVDLEEKHQSNDPEDNDKKGSKYKGRSIIWDHYTEYPDPHDNKLVRYRCNYCPKNYAYNPKTGTTTMLNHYKSCKHNPEHKPSRVIENYCRASGCGSITGVDEVSQREMCQLIQFDQAVVREALVRMIIIDELPFKFVENEGFRLFMAIACPLFLIPSRTTIGRDCLAMYKLEREKLKSFFRMTKQRISITTDLWTSNQKLSYMVLTAHFVDDEWKLQKRILNFVTCPKHKGEEVGLLIEECLNGWEIDNVFCITVDNATANDVTVNYLRRKFINKGTAVVGGKHMHVRCTAHIINLIVQSGMSEYSESIDRVRHVVKYVRSSPARCFKFDEYAAKEKVATKKSLALDVVTRWNSSYLMLERAVIFRDVFERYKMEDASIRADFPEEGPKAYPTDYDWEVASFMETILENFHGATVRVSGTYYVTANMFLDEIGTIYTLFKEWIEGPNEYLSSVAEKMKAKFDKYWGIGTVKANLIFYVASLLDPRYKFNFLKASLVHMFGDTIGASLANSSLGALRELFEEYKESTPLPKSSRPTSNSQCTVGLGVVARPLKKALKPNRDFYNRIQASIGSVETQTELEKYLAADKITQDDFDSIDCNILQWWNDHKRDYPVLARLARDVFAVPISTVASESAFSTGGRVIDDFRASLTPQNAEALICTQDWIRQGRVLTSEEEYELVQEIEDDLRVNDEESANV